MKSTEEFWTKRQHTDSSAMEGWILARHNGVLGTKCTLHSVEIMKIYLHTQQKFREINVFIVFTKEVTNEFTKYFFGESEFLVFPHYEMS